MFGVVTPTKSNLSKTEIEKYRAYYCGLCHELKRKYGKDGTSMLSYDMVFLSLLLTDLYNTEITGGFERCIAKPLKEHKFIISRYSAYSADMQMLLAYYSAYDDANDGGSSQKAAKLEPFMEKLRSEYARQDEGVRKALLRIQEEERKGTKNPEFMARLSGEMISEIFVMDDRSFFADDLRALGFGLGRFIYLMDAWCDRKKDEKKEQYNPFGRDTSWEQAKDMLMDAASDAAAAFERLPLDQHVPILRNIIYSGIWMRTKREERSSDD